MINKKLFYQNYRKEFGLLKQSVVDCCDAIIDEFNKHQEKEKDIEKKAYMLATVRHEVGPDMIPIVENMNYTAKRITEVWPSRFKTIAAAAPYAHNPQKLANNVYGNRLGNGPASTGDGYRYRGRGIGAQFTGKEQYTKWGKIFGVDLVNNPELATDLLLGAKILYKGSIEGLFTGKSLSDYINNNKVDYINARRVINADVGRNGARIARDAAKFERILRASNVNVSVSVMGKDEKVPEEATLIWPTKNESIVDKPATPVVESKENKKSTWDVVVSIFKALVGNK